MGLTQQHVLPGRFASLRSLVAITKHLGWSKPVLGTLDHSGGISHPFDPSANDNTSYDREPNNPIPGINPKQGDRSAVLLDSCASSMRDLRKRRQ